MTTNLSSSPLPTLRDLTLADVVHHFKAGTLTSTQLVRAYLTRIAEVNHEFNSVIEVNPDALAIAQARDTERTQGHYRSMLHGLPILLKDNIPTLDATETTCASLALIGAKPAKEAAVVTALRNAGAVILGKANMAEWVGFRSSSGCSGWSPRGGQTMGPYVKGSKASGSSGGCAVATALGLCFAAIGTETCYSIVSPAEKSGVVGYKPTKGLIPDEGMIYASKRQDTVGVLTRTVKDAMYITLALTEEAERNSLSPLQKRYSHPEKWISDFRRACNAENMSLAGIRIGIPVGLADIEDTPTCKLRSFERVLALMENSGAETIREVELTGACEYQNLSQEERQITLDTEMKVAINTYLSSLLVNPKRIKNLQDLIEFTKACSEEEYPARNVEGLERAQATNTENEMYKAMCEKDRYFSSCIERTLNRIECDLIVVPTLSVTLQSVAAKAGSPVMSILIGIYPKGTPVETDPKNGLITAAPGIPFSMFIFARPYDDVRALEVGSVIEKLSRVRGQLEPYMLPKTEVGYVPNE